MRKEMQNHQEDIPEKITSAQMITPLAIMHSTH